MVVEEQNGVGKFLHSRVAGPLIVSFISGAAIQLIAAVWWGAGMMYRVENLESRSKENMEYISRVDERGSRNLPLLQQEIKDIRQLAITINQNLTEHYRQSGPDVNRLLLIEERQKTVIERVSTLERLLNTNSVPFNRTTPP